MERLECLQWGAARNGRTVTPASYGPWRRKGYLHPIFNLTLDGVEYRSTGALGLHGVIQLKHLIQFSPSKALVGSTNIRVQAFSTVLRQWKL